MNPEVLEALRAIFASTGKVPFVTSDALCFMLDRVFDNWCNDAALLLDRATAAEIDTVAGEFVQAGPFFVLNLARGNPIVVEPAKMTRVGFNMVRIGDPAAAAPGDGSGVSAGA